MSKVLEAKGVKSYYFMKEGTVKAVDDVNIVVEKGDVLGLAGESGCGKSTLVNTLMMKITPPLYFVSGQIIFDGEEISKMNRKEIKRKVWGVKISLVPQSALNALMPTMKIIDLIKDIVKFHTNLPDQEIINISCKRFEELHLTKDYLYLYPHELSGGMKQRVVIAISTLLNPRLLIVDEPTYALDVSTQKRVLRLLLDLKKFQIIDSIIFVTHDIALLRQIANRLIIMYAGKAVEIGAMDELLRFPKHPYTVDLINAIITPEPEIRKKGLSSIPGEPPNLINPPSGCRFHPRCKHAMEICEKKPPPLVEITNSCLVACHLFS